VARMLPDGVSMEEVIYEAESGEHIRKTCTRMVGMAQGVRVVSEFNGIALHAEPGETPAEVEARWSADMDASTAAYRVSPEGIAQAALYAKMERDEADSVAAIMARLLSTDLLDVRAALHLIADLADKRIPAVDRDAFVAAYQNAGHLPNVNTGPAFNENDADNCARYIIGQGLAGMETVGCPHPMTQVFRKRWDAKFGAAVSA